MKIMYWVTSAIVIFAILGAGSLSFDDWTHQNTCPTLIGIPACYIVFSFFLMAGISHFVNTVKSNKLFFLLMAVPGLLALVGTVTELTGTGICPRNDSGIPMCFISLGICVILTVSKYFSLPK